MGYKQQSGFSLIELMIVVVIVGILTAIAYPNYSAYVERGKRSEGRAALTAAANRMERFYSNCNKYPTTIGATQSCSSDTVVMPTTSENGFYTLAVATRNNQQVFTLSAEPTGSWAAKEANQCGTLTLGSDGTRGRDGTGKKLAECWGK